jgi:hypothetical protein
MVGTMTDPIDAAFERVHDYNRALAREVQLEATVNLLVRLCDKLYDRLDSRDVELAELRDGLVELDHKTVSRRAFEELHTRVDVLESKKRMRMPDDSR